MNLYEAKNKTEWLLNDANSESLKKYYEYILKLLDEKIKMEDL